MAGRGTSTTERGDEILYRVAAFLEPPPELAPGTRVGDRFEIVERLGSGGMGVVYRARDDKLDRDIAIKLMKDDTPGGEQRLLGEARAMARLSHPNVVPAYELGTHEGAVFIAMELVEGTTLRAWLLERKRSCAEIVAAFRDAAAGLMAVHRAGLVHRDFKPENVLIGRDGRVRVMDLGLARPVGPPDEDAAVGFSGTPAYMSPERLKRRPADARSDQYAFCVALHEALFAALPGEAGEPRADVPRRIRAAVARGLAEDPAARHPSMEALVRALAWDPAARRRRAALVVVVTGLAGAAAWGLLVRRQAKAACAGTTILDGWNDEARAETKAAFLASGRPYAADTWSRAEKSLDAYAARIRAVRRQACAGEETPATGLQVACLDLRAAGMAELVRVLRRADPVLVDDAVSAVASLEPLDRCADAAALLGAPPLPSDPARRAQVQAALGRLQTVEALLHAGKYVAGLAAGRLLVEEARALKHEPLLANALGAAGELAWRSGDARGAETLLAEALPAAARARDDETAAWAAVSLVQVVGVEEAREDEARTLLSSAEALAARAGRPVVTAQLEGVRGILASKRGKYPEALEAYRRELSGYERAGAPLSYQSTVWHSIANVYRLSGRLEEAVAAQRRAIELLERDLGPAHPSVAILVSGLATLAYEQGRVEEAIAGHRRAYDISAAAFGPDNVEVAFMLRNLAQMEVHLGRHAEALEMLRRVLATQEAKLGPDHPTTCETRVLIGHSLRELGRGDEAVAMYDRALSGYEETLGKDHPDLVYVLISLAKVAEDRRQAGVVRAHAGRALAIARAAQGEDTPATVDPLLALGAAARLEGRREEALGHLHKGLEIAMRAFGDGHWRVARARLYLGMALIEFSRFGEAVELLERALPVLDGFRRAGGRGIVRLSLARAYWGTGERKRAVEVARAAEEECRSSCPEATRADVAAWLRRNGRR